MPHPCIPLGREILRLGAFGVPAIVLGAHTVRACRGTLVLEPLRIGDVEITRIVESEGPMVRLSWFFVDATSGERLRDEAVEANRDWLDGWALAPDGTMLFSIQSLLVRTRRHVILVDTCAGRGRSAGAPSEDVSAAPYFERLRVAGVRPEDVGLVLCTHLHSDHVGWNTLRRDGKLVPAFPRAKYVFARREWDYWKGRTPDDFGYAPIRDRVRPIVDAGRALLVEPPDEIDEEARVEPLEGHTPGQVALRISSSGREAILVGDLMHHPLQCAEPDWDSRFSVDRRASTSIRREFLERHAGTDTLVLPRTSRQRPPAVSSRTGRRGGS